LVSKSAQPPNLGATKPPATTFVSKHTASVTTILYGATQSTPPRPATAPSLRCRASCIQQVGSCRAMWAAYPVYTRCGQVRTGLGINTPNVMT
jgi:hypothetical protein